MVTGSCPPAGPFDSCYMRKQALRAGHLQDMHEECKDACCASEPASSQAWTHAAEKPAGSLEICRVISDPRFGCLQTHGPCKTITTRFRPVPLTWQWCHAIEGQTELVPLLNRRASGLSHPLRPSAMREPGWDALTSFRWASHAMPATCVCHIMVMYEAMPVAAGASACSTSQVHVQILTKDLSMC